MRSLSITPPATGVTRQGSEPFSHTNDSISFIFTYHFVSSMRMATGSTHTQLKQILPHFETKPSPRLPSSSSFSFFSLILTKRSTFGDNFLHFWRTHIYNLHSQAVSNCSYKFSTVKLQQPSHSLHHIARRITQSFSKTIDHWWAHEKLRRIIIQGRLMRSDPLSHPHFMLRLRRLVNTQIPFIPSPSEAIHDNAF